MTQQGDTKWKDRVQKFKDLVACIMDFSSDNFSEYREFVGNCIQTLGGLREMTPRTNDTRIVECPPEFLCPISKTIMKDPVVILSRETYERAVIEESFQHERICPVSKMELLDLVMTPNVLLQENIMVWSSKNHGGPFKYSDYEVLTPMEANKLAWLLQNVQSSDSSARMRAAEILRALTKFKKSHRIYLGEYQPFIETMLNAFLQKEGNKKGFEEDLYATVLHVAMHEPNRRLLGESRALILTLINGLAVGKLEAIRSACSSALSMLSSVDSNQERLGERGVLKGFLNILRRREDDMMTKDAVRGLLHLCETESNIEIFIKEGGLQLYSQQISSGKLVLVNNMVNMLVEITRSERGSILWRKSNGIKVMTSLLRNKDCSLKVKLCCINILDNLCTRDEEALRLTRGDEELLSCIAELGRSKNLTVQTKALYLINLIYN